jgi:hypothetical protein
MTSQTPESILNLDEVKILGYFESIRCVFLTKILLLFSHVNSKGQSSIIDPNTFPSSVLQEVKDIFDDPLFYKSFANKNTELYLNLQDEIVTSMLISAWSVFEQITKDLSCPNYVQSPSQLTANYENGIFQFSKQEKNDLELFYYIRNATLHYNGAYYGSKSINHRYRSKDFDSAANIGNKIEANISLAWHIALDLEKYAIKAWANVKNLKKP